MNKLRWGILSTANINGALIPAIQKSARCELAAVASRDLARSKDYAKQWNIPVAYGSYEDLLRDTNVDAVYIPLPNHLHSEWVIRSAQAGKHILCEKPLALSVQDCEKMIQAARSSKVLLAEAFMYRYHPLMNQIRKWIDEEAIGRVERIISSFTSTFNRSENYRWHKKYGGGSLWDIGCYAVDFSRVIAGEEPKEVIGRQKMASFGDVDESFFGLLIFPGGIIAQFDCGFQSFYRKKAEIVGTNGSILIDNPWHGTGNSSLTLRQECHEEIVEYKGENSYELQVRAFAEAVLDGIPLKTTAQGSLENTRTLTLLMQSADR